VQLAFFLQEIDDDGLVIHQACGQALSQAFDRALAQVLAQVLAKVHLDWVETMFVYELV
jgi:hypothetical protein